MEILTGIPETIHLQDFMSDFQDRFSFSPFMGMSSRAPTGEPYIVYSMGGVKQEGLPYPEQCKIATDAVEGFINTLNKEFPAQGKNFTLYWRRHPELILDEAYDGPCWHCGQEEDDIGCGFNGCVNGHIKHPDLYVVCARFLISDKPVIGKLVQGRD